MLPALGMSLATATTDFVSASFISYWARGTQCTSTILDPRSNLLSFSLGDRIVVFLSIPLACVATPLCTTIARARQNSKPVCGTLFEA